MRARDAAGKTKAEFTIAHTADGFADLLRRLGRLCPDRGEVPVAIERPAGRPVDARLEASHPIVPVTPNAIKTRCDGEVLSRAKSDAADAAVIAKYLRLPPSSRRCQGRVRSTPPRCSPSGATLAKPTTDPTRSPPSPASPRSPSIRQTPRRALPLSLQQTLPRCHHHLRRQLPPRQPVAAKISQDAIAPATTTRTPSASRPAPGSESSTAAGSMAPPTTPPGTATQ